MFKKLLLVVLLLAVPSISQAFCGFYVAKADTDLFNKASKVVLVRDGDRTVITMANDYEGEPTEFAMVIPVPTVLERGQINVTENKNIDHLDAYTAPRLVEYFDKNPCNLYSHYTKEAMPMMMADSGVGMVKRKTAKSLGVKIEAEYTVGEYDILILSAKESNGLQTWLDQEGYKVPEKARKVLGSYIKQGTKFFVAKVNLEEHAKTGATYLRPLQIAFESPRFMLPIRLGTVNAKDNQELFIFTLTRKGRVETTNYRTTKIPSNMDLPIFLKDKKEFGEFYKAMFDTAVEKENMKTVFLEYAWDMNWCDPCAADPLSPEQLRELGVFWIAKPPKDDEMVIQPMPGPGGQPIVQPRPRRINPKSMARDVFVTRLHVRYNGETFPEDLKFQETNDRQNFQGRYVMRHPWKGENSCDAYDTYQEQLAERFEKEAQTLAKLTKWDVNEIRSKMAKVGQKSTKPTKKWWDRLWD